MPIDLIRWGWTVLTGCGVIFGCWNLREVLIDNYAISRSKERRIELLRMQTHSAVQDHTLILLALFFDFLAGICALAAWGTGALSFLILSAIALIVLSFTHTQRRRQIFRALRFKPKEGK